MATESTVTINGAFTAPNGGTLTYAPAVINNTNAVAQSYDVPLTSTPVEITLPANSQGYGVQPLPGNTIAITHKWQSGDTGGVIHKVNGIPWISVDPSNLSFYLSSASNTSITLWTA